MELAMTPIRCILLALVALALGAPALAAEDEGHARELVNALGCKGCHSLGENGGNLGPPLTGVGRRLVREAIHLQIVNPKGNNPASMMPSYDYLPEADIEALTDYLKSLR
jgi:mono/diheme cytochrome c family protein